MHNVGQSGGFLGRLLRSFLKTGSSLIGDLLRPLVKIVLIPLGLTAAADAATHKKMFGSGVTTLIILNQEMNDMKIIKSPEESVLLRKGVSETIKNVAKEQKGGFLRMLLLGCLGASLLGTGRIFIFKSIIKMTCN